ncbi:MAG: capsular polysaccharide biosynthesis protein [Proteobacteria bacterium]|nr:capsular polysaccharide biosynthesis protein [Pseudomonadota bacterium]
MRNASKIFNSKNSLSSIDSFKFLLLSVLYDIVQHFVEIKASPRAFDVPPEKERFQTTSLNIFYQKNIDLFLGSRPRLAGYFSGKNADTFIGWGKKVSGENAVQLAKKWGKKYILLEDGFLRSVEREEPASSVVVDTMGIYYDASNFCLLDKEIYSELSDTEIARANTIAAKWREYRLSKYNAAPDFPGVLPDDYVLVIDQSFGDSSVKYGGADGRSFSRMLAAALSENPNSIVIVKVHPDVITRRRRGYFKLSELQGNKRIFPITDNWHVAGLIEKAKKIYTVTSQTGFEALIWGKQVRCFGMPFYAGRGLTDDDLAAPEHRAKAKLENLIFAALVKYSRYCDPVGGEVCQVETILEHFGRQRKMRQRFPSILYCYGFSNWKKPILRKFFLGSDIHFIKKIAQVPPDATLTIWGNKSLGEIPASINVVRVEDGFLRSVGLGANYTYPLSWILDDKGIYYDCSRRSGLETLLSNTIFDEQLISRANILRKQIVAKNITKYNLKGKCWKRPVNEHEVILVPGQVEGDSSIKYGAGSISTNFDLLRKVRESSPRAYIIYKPHPDVLAGLRSGKTAEHEFGTFCNEIVTDCETSQLLSQVDTVHTITSLLGFEALLRNVPVKCYGQPFYAGWGLTTDVMPIDRRVRKLELDELVAGTLILYPTYISRSKNCFISPQQAIEELNTWRKSDVLKAKVNQKRKSIYLRNI